MSLFGGCGTRTSLRASPPRSSIASGSSNVSIRVCLRENPRERCQCACVYLCVHLVPMLRSRLCLSCVCACACACVRRAYASARLCAESGIRNRVARGTDSTSSIGAPNEQEDRIDSPVT